MNIELLFLDCNSNPLSGRKVLFTPIKSPEITSSWLTTADSYQFTTSAAGIISSSVVANNYSVLISNPTPPTSFVPTATETGSYVYSSSFKSGSVQDVYFDLFNLVKDASTIKKVSLTPTWNYPSQFSGSVGVLCTTSSVPITSSGYAELDQLLPGIYLVDVLGKVDTTFYISVPAWANIGDGRWNAKDLLIVKPTKGIPVKLNNLDNSYVLTVSSSDARYEQKGGGDTTSSYALFALSASIANTASFSETAQTASWAINAINGGTTIVTGSTYPITASIAITASFATTALSSSAVGQTWDVQVNSSSNFYANDTANARFVAVPLTSSLTSSTPLALTQKVVIAAGSHGTVKANNVLYGCTWDNHIYAITNPDIDLTQFQVTNSIYNISGESWSAMCYSNGMLYLVGSSANNRILAVSASNIASQSTFFTVGGGVGFGPLPSICTDDTYLYIVGNTTFYNKNLFKVRISDGVMVDSSSWSGDSHACAISNGYVYMTAGANGWVGKFATNNLAAVTQSLISAFHITDDMCILGDSFYCGTEDGNVLYKVNTQSLAVTTYAGDNSYGMYTDGTNVYNTSKDGYFVVYPNADLTNPYRFSTPGLQPNELWITDGGKFVITEFSGAPNIYSIQWGLTNVVIGNTSSVYNLEVDGTLKAGAIYGNIANCIGNVSSSYAASSSVASTASYLSGSGQVVAPSSPGDIANKAYVDQLNPQGIDYYFRSSSSDISGYEQMLRLTSPLSASTSTTTVNNVSASQYFVTFVSPALNLANISQGTINIHTHIYRTGGAASNTFSPEIYIRSSSGVEYLELAAPSPVLITTTTTDSYTIPIVITSSIALHLDDRLVCKLKCNSGTGTPNIIVTVDNGTAAGVSVPVPSSAFVLRTGDTMTGTLTGPGYIGTASYSVSASYAPGGNGTTLQTGSTYPITASVAVSASYALSASYSITASFANSASWAPEAWQITGSNIYYPTGSVGINTASPRGPLDISNKITLSAPTTFNVTQVTSASANFTPVDSLVFQFGLYAYITGSFGTVYSLVNAQAIPIDAFQSTYYLNLSWSAVPNATGYKIVIVQDDYNGYVGFNYLTTSVTKLNYGLGLEYSASVQNPMIITPTKYGVNIYTDSATSSLVLANTDIFTDSNINGNITSSNVFARTFNAGTNTVNYDVNHGEALCIDAMQDDSTISPNTNVEVARFDVPTANPYITVGKVSSSGSIWLGGYVEYDRNYNGVTPNITEKLRLGVHGYSKGWITIDKNGGIFCNDAITASSIIASTAILPIIGSNTVIADLPPSTSIVMASNAFSGSITNTSGSNLILAGGIGRNYFTVLSGRLINNVGTITVTVNGSVSVKTAGVDFFTSSVATNVAYSMSNAINTISGVTSNYSGSNVYVIPNVGTYALSLATNASAATMSIVSGTGSSIMLETDTLSYGNILFPTHNNIGTSRGGSNRPDSVYANTRFSVETSNSSTTLILSGLSFDTNGSISSGNTTGIITLGGGGRTNDLNLIANGNFGVGTTTPLAKLHVNGNSIMPTIGGNTVTSDVPPSQSIVMASNAWSASITNTSGSNLILAGGLGRNYFTIFSGSLLSGSTVSVTVNGTTTTLIASSSFNISSSNYVTATSMSAALNTISGISSSISGSTAPNPTLPRFVYVTPSVGTYQLSLADSVANTTMSLTTGSSGYVQFNTASSPPTNTTTPVGWIDVMVLGAVYKMPLYT